MLERAALAGLACGVQGPLDFPVLKPGLPGCYGQWAEVGRVVGVQRPVGGPEQARVAVSLTLAGDPAGQVIEAAAV